MTQPVGTKSALERLIHPIRIHIELSQYMLGANRMNVKVLRILAKKNIFRNWRKFLEIPNKRKDMIHPINSENLLYGEDQKAKLHRECLYLFLLIRIFLFV